MTTDIPLINGLITRYCTAALKKDAGAMLRLYDENVLLFDMWDRSAVRGLAEWAPIVRDWLGGLGSETVHVEFEQVDVQAGTDVAVLTAFVHFQARDATGAMLREMRNRLTWSLVRRGVDWKILHQHTSIPIDSKTIAPKFNGDV
ncbi:MAG TPA: nuclear transport factor 2 family protein [Lacunisphaera sp.]|jgi:ketosteroid isomerase-like protein